MPDNETTLTARLDDSDVKAKIAGLNRMVDELMQKLQGLSTGASGGGIPGAAPPSTPGSANVPPINQGSSRRQGVAPPPITPSPTPPASTGNVGTNAFGIPNRPIVRTATNGQQVSYNPQTGQWTVVPPAAPPPPPPGGSANAGGAGPPVPPAAPPTTAPSAATGGPGLRNAAGLYIGAHQLGTTASDIAQAYAQASQTGRAIQWYDFSGTYGALGLGALGAGIGSIVPVIGTALGFGIGTVLGNTFGGALTTYAHMREEQGYGTALLKAAGGSGADAFLSASAFDDKSGKERTTVGALALAMGRGNTSPYRADLIMSRLLAAAGDDNGARTLAFQQADAIAKGMGNDPAISDFINRPFTRGGAFATLQAGGPDALMGYLATQGRREGVYGYIEQMRQSQLSGIHAQLMGIFPQQAAYATQAITARGGTAAEIAGGMGQQVSALQNAASATERYIKSLEGMGSATDTQRIAIEKAKTELAGLNAQIATLGNQAATVKMQEAVDISGTRVATAGAGTATAMMTMGRGGNIMGAYSPLLSAQAQNVATLQEQLNAPNLRPEQRREIQRQLAAAQVSAMQGLRQAATDTFGFPARLATLDAGYSGAYAAIAGIGQSDPAAAANLALRAGQARGRSASALWTQYTGMSRSGLFDAVTLAQARNAAWGEAAQSLGMLNSPSLFSPTGTQEAALAEAAAQAFTGARAGGSIGALGGFRQQMGVFGDLATAYGAIRDDALARGGNPVATNANYRAAMAGNALQQAQARAALGNFQLSPATGSALDAAQFQFQMLMASPFVPGNRLTAGTGLLQQLGVARGEAEKYLATADLDPTNRRSVQQQIYGYQMEEQRLRENLNVGWLDRIASREMFAPSHSALVGLSNRDYLMVDPTGNRRLGTASRRSYEYTDGAAYAAMPGTGAGNRPGDMNAQAVRIYGELELTGNVGDFLKSNGVHARVSVRSDPRGMLMQKVPTG